MPAERYLFLFKKLLVFFAKLPKDDLNKHMR